MKRWLLIGIGAVVVACSAGAAAYFLLSPGKGAQDASPAVKEAKKKATRDGASVDRDIHVAELMRDLSAAQDAVAYGAKEAIRDQRRLTAELGETFRAFQQKDWHLYRNFRTALVYVLSGGEPGIIERSIENNTSIGEADEKLARGIIAFALGQAKAARMAFADTDPRSLDVALVGPFSLARASLYLEKDPMRAIKLLDDARLACPHTAIEEAAMRREIPLLVSQGLMPRAKLLMADYVRRFGKSLYAQKLFRDFADEIAKSSGNDNEAFVSELYDRMQPSDPEATGQFFISMAAEALPHGHLELAKAAAREVLKPGRGLAADVMRAKLYIAAAEAPSAKSAQALAALREMGEESLSGEDVGIREVAQFVARAVSGDHQLPIGKAAGIDTQQGTAPLPFGAQVAAALADADSTVNEADSLMSEVDR